MIPSAGAFALLALAAFRVWKLVADDTITEPARKRWVDGHDWRETFVECPWCAGFWITLAWWASWWAFPTVALVVAVPFALSAVVGLIAAALSVATD